MGRLLTDEAKQGITVYNRFIEDANYSFNHSNGDEGYRTSDVYVIKGGSFRYTYTSNYYTCFYPDVDKREELLELVYKDKSIEYASDSDNYMIRAEDESHDNYSCDGRVIYGKFNKPLFEVIEDGKLFISCDKRVLYDPTTDKVYLSRLGGYEIDFDKDILEQVDDFINSYCPVEYLRKEIQREIASIASKYDYRLEDIGSDIDSLLSKFKPMIPVDKKIIVSNAVKSIKAAYRHYIDCMEFKVEADALIKQIDDALSTISNIVNEEYRKIPGSHVYTTDERVKVNVNSRDKIRKTFNKEPQE